MSGYVCFLKPYCTTGNPWFPVSRTLCLCGGVLGRVPSSEVLLASQLLSLLVGRCKSRITVCRCGRMVVRDIYSFDCLELKHLAQGYTDKNRWFEFNKFKCFLFFEHFIRFCDVYWPHPSTTTPPTLPSTPAPPPSQLCVLFYFVIINNPESCYSCT